MTPNELAERITRPGHSLTLNDCWWLTHLDSKRAFHLNFDIIMALCVYTEEDEAEVKLDYDTFHDFLKHPRGYEAIIKIRKERPSLNIEEEDTSEIFNHTSLCDLTKNSRV